MLFSKSSATSRALLHRLALAPLLRSLGHDGERVNPRLELLAQTLVDHPVASDQLGVPELITDHQHLEMGLGAPGDVVHVGLVDDLQVERAELGRQFPVNRLRHRTYGLLSGHFTEASVDDIL